MVYCAKPPFTKNLNIRSYIYVFIRIKTYIGVNNMEKEKAKKIAAIYVVVAFIAGAVVGYIAYDLTNTGFRYQFEIGDKLLLNSGFEDEIEESPAHWYMAIMPADNLTLTWDDEVRYTGNRSVSISNNHIYDEEVCNNWAQIISIVPVGRTVELSGWVKTIDAESVVMVIQCWDEDDNNLIGFGSTQSTTNITGTSDWQMYKASVKVPGDTDTITVRLVLTGIGQVWFDDVQLVVK